MQQKNSNPKPLSFNHPLFIILGAIVIAFGGYLFGGKIYEMFH